MSVGDWRRPEQPGWMNWRPIDWSEAFDVQAMDGPLVDPEDGRVIFDAMISPQNWSALVHLPLNCDPVPFPTKAEADAAIGNGPRGVGPMQFLPDGTVAPYRSDPQSGPSSTHDAFATALAA